MTIKMKLSEFKLSEMLGIEIPVIVAPMFLVSNSKMIISAINSGATGAIPALNYRSLDDLRDSIRQIKETAKGPFGINLIVNNSNFIYREQLDICCEEKVDFIITSLGSPEETIEQAHKVGIKVFCDVTDLHYAQKVEDLGADAIIAVNNKAGGHAGSLSPEVLIPKLKSNCNIPIISAGGVGNGKELAKIASLGADGFSIGSIFIATEESDVSSEYKEACIKYGAKDIVMTEKLSGTPCTVINTPYVSKIGTKQNIVEKLLNKNKKLKKLVKSFIFIKGMKKLKDAAFSATYKTVWCAGSSIEHVHEIKSVQERIESLINKYEETNG